MIQIGEEIMRDKKELIYLNMKDIIEEEQEALGDMELNCCDVCGEIDSTYRLNWIEGEDFWNNEAANRLVEKGNCAVCNECLEEEEEEEE